MKKSETIRFIIQTVASVLTAIATFLGANSMIN